jgi:predicted nucleic acid-binding protein
MSGASGKEARTMTANDPFAGVDRLFLDTAPIIYYVERHPKYGPIVDPIFAGIDEHGPDPYGWPAAATSAITLAECLVVPIRSNQTSLQQAFTQLIVSGAGIRFVAVDDFIARDAAELRARYNLSLTDAIQVAVAFFAGCDAFLTNDRDLKRVGGMKILLIDELGAET